MLIINGTVHTMDGLTIPNGYVAVSGDKIAKVGPMEECPAHWEAATSCPASLTPTVIWVCLGTQ